MYMCVLQFLGVSEKLFVSLWKPVILTSSYFTWISMWTNSRRLSFQPLHVHMKNLGMLWPLFPVLCFLSVDWFITAAT